jgi:Fe-S cluster biogenesis protein NfuA
MAEENQVAEESSSTSSAAPVVDEAELDSRRHALEDLIQMMRPSVQVDGGDLKLVSADYATGVVEVELEGACGSCAIAGLTLEGGVDRLLKEHLPWVTEVIGGVDTTIDALASAAMGRGAYFQKYY